MPAIYRKVAGNRTFVFVAATKSDGLCCTLPVKQSFTIDRSPEREFLDLREMLGEAAHSTFITIAVTSSCCSMPRPNSRTAGVGSSSP